MAPPFILALLASAFFQSVTATYVMAQDYTGDAFYEGFEFFTDKDPTNGFVQFQSMAAANSSGIAGFMEGGNAHHAVYLGVDATNKAPNGRNSIRVNSKKTFQHGLIITDIAHMPGGICGTWPAFWMLGANWPTNGEIDILEGVHDQSTNSMTLHTSKGPVVGDGEHFLGKLVTSNCDVNAPKQNKNAGCSISDASAIQSYGTDFNNAGGGVFATEWTSEFIKVWFFPRVSIPSDITSNNPSPNESVWGTPNSVFQGSFNIDDHFNNLQIIFDTTFCGDFAGAVWNSTSTCAALAPTCEQYVANTPDAFKDAYWAVNILQVFQDDTDAAAKVTDESAPPPAAPQPSPAARRRSGGARLERL